ncbi:MAG: hypothetical protein HFJ40_03305 [Clostridia bacterium]|nr:hypothetical protein [Clostridia bacterium]
MNKKSYEETQNKGITLIALVITIIVLLILAGVSIAMLIGKNGLISQSMEAKQETEIAKIKEEVQLHYEDAVIQAKVDVANNKLNIFENNLKKDDSESKVIGSGKTITALYKDYYITLDENGNIVDISKANVDVNWEEAKVLVIDNNIIKGFTNINDATTVAETKEVAKIVLLDDIEGNDQKFVTITGKDITLDLNGHTIKNNYYDSVHNKSYVLYIEAEKVKIVNGKIDYRKYNVTAGIHIDNKNTYTEITNVKIETNGECLNNETQGTTVLADNEFKGNLAHNHTGRCISNSSTLEINSGVYQDDLEYTNSNITLYTIVNSGTCNINNTDIERTVLNSGGIVNVYSGNLKTLSNSSNGTMNIYGGKIGTETSGGGISNNANLNIYDCDYCHSISGDKNGTNYIYGGNIRRINYINVVIENGTVGSIYQPTSVVIKGGRLTGINGGNSLQLWGGSVDISGGVFDTKWTSGNGSKWTITGGKFKFKVTPAEGYSCIGPNEEGYYEVVK